MQATAHLWASSIASLTFGGSGSFHAERIPLPVSDPAADLRVGLLRRLRIRVVVERRVPPVGVDVADRVAAGGDVSPERRRVGGVGEDRADADDRGGAVERDPSAVPSPSRPHPPVDGLPHRVEVGEQPALGVVDRIEAEALG